MTQPTIDDIHAAWTNAIVSLDIPGARAEAIQELKDLRAKKSTWVGDSENELRRAINDFLDAVS